ncbi:hypothetical protein MKZ08_20775 [Viridibacillus sp. FSL R5-0477]|uniref:Uncharacterized protein n=1 Tax=Viridibacillus arenosi FSL R5-213 TaxID=1227360 RepID=W4F559_9BACL|nr:MULTISPECIES: hypothetical protein [Viridibacillus]ETT87477.1 hypothetical protein C176_04973 [Viridibacillus arenosi FSL R5-213]OMC82541.1 hypothetical protein BK130_11255 [Viridibacillus sp. FSL H8-0123]OMC87717.1 hypothetical protein BK128_05165 [Viridibacillus sp. FSL H7-0596]OMC91261.1 hypothetical protein BK137_09260 [Viridibacillus arenosi]
MSKKAKKVVLLLVEGACEEALLYDRIRTLFNNNEIRFDIIKGDILGDLNQKNSNIKNLIGDRVKSYINKMKLGPTDLLAIIQIADTDGCFIGESAVIIDENQDRLTLYNATTISVPNSNQQSKIIERNKLKSKNIHTMRTLNTILSGKVNYQIYYFSRALEHILFNEANPETRYKVREVEEFLENEQKPIEEFLSNFLPISTSMTLEEKYLESWQSISADLASLERFTNVSLMFDYMKMINE